MTLVIRVLGFWNSCHTEIQQLYLEAAIEVPLLKIKMCKRSYYKDAIAIVGHSCRFPEANSSEEFWELLMNAGDGIRFTPEERYELLHLDEKRFKGYKGGFLKCPVDEFDAKFFGISPREAELIDPQQRLLLEVAWEALENAAINPHSLKGGNTGVFTGVWQAEYERLVKENTPTKAFHNIVLGNSFSATSARLSYFLGLNGPNIATESGCSSSMVALHLACQSLKSRETDLGLVMGANIIDIHEEGIPILAKDGHCKAFDEKADGFARSEGVAVIVLKRLSDAISNGDRVIGIIRGSALSNEGTSSSFGTPSKICQEIAIRDALRNSGVCPEDVDYVEAHGTGTPVGDPVEFSALSACYASPRENPLIVGSVKTNIGHTESAAGLAGIIKVILSMKNEIIPSHKNFETLNPNINLKLIPAIVPVEQQSWKRSSERVRIAGVSSFGISGTNVHVLIEEPPTDNDNGAFMSNSLDVDKTFHILNLSAKTENALDELVYRYSKFLEENPQIDINNLCSTTNCGRAHFNHRTSFIGKDNHHLAKAVKGESFFRTVSNESMKIAFLFTGQGHYLGMAHGLYTSNSVFRSSFDKCARIIERETGVILQDVIWTEVGQSMDHCTPCQLSIFCVQYAILNLFSSLGIKPDFVLGNSVGEYAAGVASGVFDLEDALILLIQRSQLISKLPSGGMMAISCSKETGEELIRKYSQYNTNEWIDIAVVNSSKEIVVAGKKETLEKFQKMCTSNKIRFKILSATHAYHSRHIDEILSKLDDVASKMKYKNPSCQYVSGLTGSILITDEMSDGKYWLRHARYPVNFLKGIHTLVENGCNTFVEIGPGPILLALGIDNVNTIGNTLWLPTLQQNKDNWEVLLGSLGKLYVNGATINWCSIYPPEHRKKLELPTYPFQRQKYWINVPEKNETKTIHPLLGKKVSLVSKNETVYTNYINLKDFSFINDHKVASLVIMPGAGFLEIILAVGKDLLQVGNNSNALHVKDFVIESAFELEEGIQYEMQIVATPQDNKNDSLVVGVHVFNKLNGWKKHAGAIMSLLQEMDSLLQFKHENMECFKARCEKQKSSSDIYNTIQKSGVNFGESFYSIESIWSLGNEALAVIPVKPLSWNIVEYIFHPIVLDAMLQAVGLTMEIEDSTLYLPVGIDSCFATGELPSDIVFAHAHWDTSSNKGTVVLYNKQNALLFSMVGVRIVPTTINSFLNTMARQKNTLPELYHEIWFPRLSPVQCRIELKMLSDLSNIIYPLEKAMENDMKSYNSAVQKLLNDYVHLKLIKMFNENGVFLNLGETYFTESIVTNNLISSKHNKLFDRIIDMFVEDGNIIRYDNFDHWKVVKEFSTFNDIQYKLEKLHMELKTAIPVDLDIVEKCCDSLWDVVTEKVDPTAALFGRTDMNILDVYTKGLNVTLANVRMAKILGLIFSDLKLTISSKEIPVVRIVEIGGGSSATSKEILKVLQQIGISYQYTFTDISSQFFDNAKTELSAFETVDYKVLDIEKDPSAQGFYPNYYDIVVASNVIHATENLKVSIGNVKKLLVHHGILLLQEILIPWRATDVIFGILESYWKFNDYNLRKSNPMVSKDIWDQVLTENGFGLSYLLSSKTEFISVLAAKAGKINYLYDNKSITSRTTGKTVLQNTCLVYCDDGLVHEGVMKRLSTTFEYVIPLKHGVKSDPQCVQFLNMLDELEFTKDLNRITETYDICGVVYLMSLDNDHRNGNDLYLKTLNFCKYFSKSKHTSTKFLAVTRGAVCTPNQKNVFPLGAVIWGMFKSLMSEIPKLIIRILDLDPDVIDAEQAEKQIFYEMYNSETRFVCYRKGKKLVPRYVKFSEDHEALSLPKGRYKIQVPKTKRIADISFSSQRNCPLEPDDVEVVIKAMSFNFRDILVIIKPDGFQSLFDEVGSDFAGVVSKIGTHVTKFKPGDEVFGFGTTGTAASHIVLKETFAIYHIPSHFSIFEAATIFICQTTAHYCLITIANLKKDETVLIHVASGGVGLYAIQVAQYIGAKIIVTAGSHRKRSYLRSLGLENVFHSRDLTFGNEIRNVTNGYGVDVVLNSLTSEGFKETTLESCAINARFVEIGKVNIWQSEDVQTLRPDVTYTIFNLETTKPKDLDDNIQLVFKKDVIKPVAYSRFDITNIRNALNYFMKSQHIGKIVLSMPEISNISGQLVTKEILFNGNATYLITGGLGGIGLVVAKWMADCGAGCLVLIGRSAPNPETLLVINSLRTKGCRVLTFEVDVGNYQQCENLFISLDKLQLPPLKGVIHSAGVLSDGIFANQTWEKYQPVFNAKIKGCVNLHKLTKDMQLEHFLLFSSMASAIAPIGQSNHCAANSFLDAFAHYRHSIGLPVQSINWGAWCKVGAAANIDIKGIYPFNPIQGIAALQIAMSRPNLVQLGVAQLNVKELGHVSPLLDQYFEQSPVQTENNVDGSSTIVQSKKFWEDIKPLSIIDRSMYIRNQLVHLTKATLKLPKGEPLNEDQIFSEMGLDSLMSVELKNKFQTLLGDSLVLSALTLVDYPTINKLSQYLAEATLGMVAVTRESKRLKVNEIALKELIKKDCMLAEDVTGNGSFVKASQVRNIFLTGGTGYLGIHLLEQLLKFPSLNVICLIRGSTEEQTREKIVSNLKKHELSVDFNRISVVKGDVAQEQFGLSTEEYNRLSENIDSVYHVAAKVSFIEDYMTSSSNRTDIRSVNVLGTINVLRFAGHTKTKRVFYSSSMAAVNKLNSDGFAYEDFPDDENNGEGIAMGYALTKFVSEKLISQAISRGIPCIAIRYPTVAGNSKSGHFTLGSDVVLNIFLMAIKLGLIFNNEGGWSLLSADIAAELTMDLLFNDNVDSEMYNLLQPNSIQGTELVNMVTSLGYHLVIVNQDEFFGKIQQESDSTLLSHFKRVYGSDFLNEVMRNNDFIAKELLTGSLTGNKLSHKLLSTVPNISERIGNSYYGFKSCLLHAESSGILKGLRVFNPCLSSSEMSSA